MIVYKPYTVILTTFTGHELEDIERIGRVCYKSEDKITDGSAEKFVRGLIKRGHEAMLEHGIISVKFVCDRGVSHELVRHRLASFAQESTRYCNYATDEGEIIFIRPFFFMYNPKAMKTWMTTMKGAEEAYLELIKMGRTPQEARTVLPNSLKTEVIMTANYREWRHFFNLRAARATGPAHPQMEELAVPLLKKFNDHLPAIFGDIWEKCVTRFDGDVLLSMIYGESKTKDYEE